MPDSSSGFFFSKLVLYLFLTHEGDTMKWFNKLPPEIRHLLSSIITALILAQSVKYGYITPEQAATIPAPAVSVSTPIQ